MMKRIACVLGCVLVFILMADAVCGERFILLDELSEKEDAGTTLSSFDGKLWIGVLRTDDTNGTVPHVYTYEHAGFDAAGYISLTDKHINDFEVYNGKIYCAVDYYARVYEYGSGSWTLKVTPSVVGANYETQLGMHDSKLIIGTQNWGKVFSWDGTDTSGIGALFSGSSDRIGDFISFDGDLWAGNANWGQAHRHDTETGATAWADRTSLYADRNAMVTALVDYNDTLYAAVYCDNDTQSRIYQYDGSSWSLWSRLPDEAKDIDLEVYNGKLFAAGDYYSCVYVYENGAWTLLQQLSNDTENAVDLQVYDGKLYAGLDNKGAVYVSNTTYNFVSVATLSDTIGAGTTLGSFDSKLWIGVLRTDDTNSTVPHVYTYDLLDTSAAGYISLTGNHINDFEVYNNKLYCAVDYYARVYEYGSGSWTLTVTPSGVGANYETQLGMHDSKLIIGTQNWGKVFSWDGSTTSGIGALLSGSSDRIGDLVSFDGDLWAGNANWGQAHRHDTETGTTVWADRTSLYADRYAMVTALVDYNDTLYAAVYCDNDTQSRIYQYDGSSWSLWSRLPDETKDIDLEVYNGKLFAAGDYYSRVYVYENGAWTIVQELSSDTENAVDLEVCNGVLFAGLSRYGEVFECRGSEGFESNSLLAPRAGVISSDYMSKIQNIDADTMIWVPRIAFHTFFPELESPYMYRMYDSYRLEHHTRFGLDWKYKFEMAEDIHAKIALRAGSTIYTVQISTDPDDSYTYLSRYDDNPEPMDEIDVTDTFTSYDTVYVRPVLAWLRYLWFHVGVDDQNLNGVSDIVEDLLDNQLPESSDTDSYSAFQVSGAWEYWYDPGRDLRLDEVFFTCAEDTVLLNSWRNEAGYEYVDSLDLYFGNESYTDYLDGTFDGSTHYDELQLDSSGDTYRILTTSNWQSYFNQEILAPILDGGVDRVVCQEPFNYATTGYSDAFKDEYEIYHGGSWVDPASSVDARFNCEKVRANLWNTTIDTTGYYVHQSGGDTLVYTVAVHSPINNKQWSLTFSNEILLNTTEVDRIFAYVWTDTIKSNITYRGTTGERAIDYGYLEYSYYDNFARDLYELWFLHDPASDEFNVKDNQWSEYQAWYEKTVISSLFFPDVTKFVLAPWPQRIFIWEGSYAGFCPQDYRTEILSVFRAFEDLHNDTSTTRNYTGCSIGIPVADSMMWQSTPTPTYNPLKCLAGMALPLLNKGIPVKIFPMERSDESGYLDEYDVIVMSYDVFKPLDESYDTAIANWVKAGGTLLLFEGNDTYNNVSEWWSDNGYSSPADDLLAKLGISLPASSPTQTSVSSGILYYEATSPETFADSSTQADRLINLVKDVIEDSTSYTYDDPQKLVITRGDYTAIYASEKADTTSLSGLYVDIFDPNLSIVEDPNVAVGEYGFYKSVPDTTTKPLLLVTNSKVKYLTEGDTKTAFVASGPLGTVGISKFVCDNVVPSEFHVYNQLGEELPMKWDWDGSIGVFSLKYNHSSWGDVVIVKWE
jgi:hypothetical protein